MLQLRLNVVFLDIYLFCLCGIQCSELLAEDISRALAMNRPIDW